MNLQVIIKWIREHPLVVVFYLIATTFFIYQHISHYAWDFEAYVLNANYWFSHGTYFEPMRPPLVPLLLGLLIIFGEKTSEMVFIFLVSTFFFITSLLIARELKVNETIWYALSLSTFTLVYGLAQGTELLSLALVQLTIVLIMREKAHSGITLGLAILTRYASLPLGLILLANRKPKNIIKSIILFLLTILPWLIYSYLTWGNIFTSIADGYASNILYRNYTYQPSDLIHIFNVALLLIPFAILGILNGIRTIMQKNIPSKITILIIFVGIATVYTYLTTPIKIERYLFLLVLPITLASISGLELLTKKFRTQKVAKIISSVIFIASLIIALILLHNVSPTKEEYTQAVSTIKSLGIENCSIGSNGWVVLNYLGISATPAPKETLITKEFDEGKQFVFLKNILEPNYIKNETFLDLLEPKYRTSTLIVLGKDTCQKPEPYDKTYVENTRADILEIHRYNINTNPCFILFHRVRLAEKTCNLINYGNFSSDSNTLID